MSEPQEIQDTEPQQEREAAAVGKATVQFTLHFHLADGTVKDVPCVGTVTSVESQ